MPIPVELFVVLAIIQLWLIWSVLQPVGALPTMLQEVYMEFWLIAAGWLELKRASAFYRWSPRHEGLSEQFCVCHRRLACKGDLRGRSCNRKAHKFQFGPFWRFGDSAVLFGFFWCFVLIRHMFCWGTRQQTTERHLESLKRWTLDVWPTPNWGFEIRWLDHMRGEVVLGGPASRLVVSPCVVSNWLSRRNMGKLCAPTCCQWNWLAAIESGPRWHRS